MLVGNGMIARAFTRYKRDKDILIFASGVSNSKETLQSAIEREKKLLCDNIEKYQDLIFVYFSTCSIEDKTLEDSLYVKHKIQMEKIVQNRCKKYYIFRLPQVVGISKSPTLINFLVKNIIKENDFVVYKNATRNLIAIEDVYYISKKIIENKHYENEIVNIATPFNISVLDIVKIIEKILNKKANYTINNLGEAQEIDITKILNLNLDFKSNYTNNLLNKYVNKINFNYIKL